MQGRRFSLALSRSLFREHTSHASTCDGVDENDLMLSAVFSLRSEEYSAFLSDLIPLISNEDLSRWRSLRLAEANDIRQLTPTQQIAFCALSNLSVQLGLGKDHQYVVDAEDKQWSMPCDTKQASAAINTAMRFVSSLPMHGVHDSAVDTMVGSDILSFFALACLPDSGLSVADRESSVSCLWALIAAFSRIEYLESVISILDVMESDDRELFHQLWKKMCAWLYSMHESVLPRIESVAGSKAALEVMWELLRRWRNMSAEDRCQLCDEQPELGFFALIQALLSSFLNILVGQNGSNSLLPTLRKLQQEFSELAKEGLVEEPEMLLALLELAIIVSSDDEVMSEASSPLALSCCLLHPSPLWAFFRFHVGEDISESATLQQAWLDNGEACFNAMTRIFSSLASLFEEAISLRPQHQDDFTFCSIHTPEFWKSPTLPLITLLSVLDAVGFSVSKHHANVQSCGKFVGQYCSLSLSRLDGSLHRLKNELDQCQKDDERRTILALFHDVLFCCMMRWFYFLDTFAWEDLGDCFSVSPLGDILFKLDEISKHATAVDRDAIATRSVTTASEYHKEMVETAHPYQRSNFGKRIEVAEGSRITITFDPRSHTDEGVDVLLVRCPSASEFQEFSGSSWEDVVIEDGGELFFNFRVESWSGSGSWGWAAKVSIISTVVVDVSSHWMRDVVVGVQSCIAKNVLALKRLDVTEHSKNMMRVLRWGLQPATRKESISHQILMDTDEGRRFCASCDAQLRSGSLAQSRLTYGVSDSLRRLWDLAFSAVLHFVGWQTINSGQRRLEDLDEESRHKLLKYRELAGIAVRSWMADIIENEDQTQELLSNIFNVVEFVQLLNAPSCFSAGGLEKGECDVPSLSESSQHRWNELEGSLMLAGQIREEVTTTRSEAEADANSVLSFISLMRSTRKAGHQDLYSLKQTLQSSMSSAVIRLAKLELGLRTLRRNGGLFKYLLLRYFYQNGTPHWFHSLVCAAPDVQCSIQEKYFQLLSMCSCDKCGIEPNFVLTYENSDVHFLGEGDMPSLFIRRAYVDKTDQSWAALFSFVMTVAALSNHQRDDQSFQASLRYLRASMVNSLLRPFRLDTLSMDGISEDRLDVLAVDYQPAIFAITVAVSNLLSYRPFAVKNQQGTSLSASMELYRPEDVMSPSQLLITDPDNAQAIVVADAIEVLFSMMVYFPYHKIAELVSPLVLRLCGHSSSSIVNLSFARFCSVFPAKYVDAGGIDPLLWYLADLVNQRKPHDTGMELFDAQGTVREDVLNRLTGDNAELKAVLFTIGNAVGRTCLNRLALLSCHLLRSILSNSGQSINRMNNSLNHLQRVEHGDQLIEVLDVNDQPSMSRETRLKMFDAMRAVEKASRSPQLHLRRRVFLHLLCELSIRSRYSESVKKMLQQTFSRTDEDTPFSIETAALMMGGYQEVPRPGSKCTVDQTDLTLLNVDFANTVATLVRTLPSERATSELSISTYRPQFPSVTMDGAVVAKAAALLASAMKDAACQEAYIIPLLRALSRALSSPAHGAFTGDSRRALETLLGVLLKQNFMSCSSSIPNSLPFDSRSVVLELAIEHTSRALKSERAVAGRSIEKASKPVICVEYNSSSNTDDVRNIFDNNVETYWKPKNDECWFELVLNEPKALDSLRWFSPRHVKKWQLAKEGTVDVDGRECASFTLSHFGLSSVNISWKDTFADASSRVGARWKFTIQEGYGGQVSTVRVYAVQLLFQRAGAVTSLSFSPDAKVSRALASAPSFSIIPEIGTDPNAEAWVRSVSLFDTSQDVASPVVSFPRTSRSRAASTLLPGPPSQYSDSDETHGDDSPFGDPRWTFERTPEAGLRRGARLVRGRSRRYGRGSRGHSTEDTATAQQSGLNEKKSWSLVFHEFKRKVDRMEANSESTLRQEEACLRKDAECMLCLKLVIQLIAGLRVLPSKEVLDIKRFFSLAVRAVEFDLAELTEAASRVFLGTLSERSDLNTLFNLALSLGAAVPSVAISHFCPLEFSTSILFDNVQSGWIQKSKNCTLDAAEKKLRAILNPHTLITSSDGVASFSGQVVSARVLAKKEEESVEDLFIRLSTEAVEFTIVHDNHFEKASIVRSNAIFCGASSVEVLVDQRLSTCKEHSIQLFLNDTHTSPLHVNEGETLLQLSTASLYWLTSFSSSCKKDCSVQLRLNARYPSNNELNKLQRTSNLLLSSAVKINLPAFNEYLFSRTTVKRLVRSYSKCDTNARLPILAVIASLLARADLFPNNALPSRVDFSPIVKNCFTLGRFTAPAQQSIVQAHYGVMLNLAGALRKWTRAEHNADELCSWPEDKECPYIPLVQNEGGTLLARRSPRPLSEFTPYVEFSAATMADHWKKDCRVVLLGFHPTFEHEPLLLAAYDFAGQQKALLQGSLLKRRLLDSVLTARVIHSDEAEETAILQLPPNTIVRVVSPSSQPGAPSVGKLPNMGCKCGDKIGLIFLVSSRIMRNSEEYERTEENC